MKKLLVSCAVIVCVVITLVITAGCKSESSGTIIGISKIVSHPALDAVEKGIQDELHDLGFDDLKFDLQNANGDPNAAAQIASKFKNDKVAIAVGIATPTAQALVGTLTEIPVVFSAVTDPVSAGLVESADKGTKNVTGISDMTPVRSQIKMLHTLVKVKRLGTIYSSNEDNSITLANITKQVCKDLGIEYVEATVTNSSEVKQAAESLVGKVDGLYLSTDNTVFSALASVLDVANRNNIPLMSADPSSAEDSDIFAAYGFNYYMIGRATGILIADILEGKKTIDMPTVYLDDPTSFDLVINLDIAKKMGITIPEKIINSANIIIKDGKVVKK